MTSSIGLALCLGSVILSMAMTGSVANRVGEAMREAEQKTNRSAQSATAAAPVIPDGKPKGIAAQPTTPPAPVVETWLSPDQPGQLGDVQVRLLSVTLAPVVLLTAYNDERAKSKEPMLSIVLEVSNVGPNLKLDFKTLSGERFFGQEHKATLVDNFGNHYRGIDFGSSSRPEFRTVDASIYPGKMIKDQLVFEAPIGTAAHLDLQIPAMNVGQEGFFRFRIPEAGHPARIEAQ